MLSVWNPSGQSLIENAINQQLPGEVDGNTRIVVETIDHTGAAVHSRTIPTDGTFSNAPFSVGGVAIGTVSADYARLSLPPGFYRVYPKGHPETGYVVVVGDPASLAAAIQKDLRDQAGRLTEAAEDARDKIQDGRFTRTVTTTNATGYWNVTGLGSQVNSVSVQAYKKPSGLETDPQNITMQSLRDHYETELVPETVNPNALSDAAKKAVCGVTPAGEVVGVGSTYVPARSPTVSVPSSGVDVEVREVTVPPLFNSSRYGSQKECLFDLFGEQDAADQVQQVVQRVTGMTLDALRSLYEALIPLVQANPPVEERYKSILGDREPYINSSNASKEELRVRIDAATQALSEARSDIGSGPPSSDITNNTVSLVFPFDRDLQPDQVAVLATWTNGTTETLTPDGSQYVSIEGRIGGDAVRVDDYPIGPEDPAAVSFEVIVSTPGGVGHGRERVRNPDFGGTLLDIDGITLSSLRPGPSDTVDVTVHPAGDGQYKNLTGITVHGPDGNTVSSNRTGTRTAEFTTDGNGSYHVQLTVTSVNDREYTTAFRIEASQIDRPRPPGVRAVESPMGVYALAGDGLHAGDIEIAKGGGEATVLATIPSGDDPPGRLHVYTSGLSLAPDNALTVRVVRAPDQRQVQARTTVTLHYKSLGDDALLRREGDPLPQSGSQLGNVTDHPQSTEVETVTDADGTVTVRTNANPGLLAELEWRADRFIDRVTGAAGAGGDSGFPVVGWLAVLASAGGVRRWRRR